MTPHGPHAHPAAPEAAAGPSAAGSVVLDIGPGVGAAIVVTRSDLCGHEIEIRRAGAAWDGTHVEVRQRTGAGTTKFAAIFGSLAAGRYEFRLRGAGASEVPVLVAEVGEASVALAHWPVDQRGVAPEVTAGCPA